jgi:hypothetical protein
MPGDLVEHVGEEGQGRLHVRRTPAVELDGHVNLRFLGRSLLAAGPHGVDSTTATALSPSLRRFAESTPSKVIRVLLRSVVLAHRVSEPKG